MVEVEFPGICDVEHSRGRRDGEGGRLALRPEGAALADLDAALGLRHSLINGRVACDDERLRGENSAPEAFPPPTALGRFDLLLLLGRLGAGCGRRLVGAPGAAG